MNEARHVRAIAKLAFPGIDCRRAMVIECQYPVARLPIPDTDLGDRVCYEEVVLKPFGYKSKKRTGWVLLAHSRRTNTILYGKLHERRIQHGEEPVPVG